MMTEKEVKEIEMKRFIKEIIARIGGLTLDDRVVVIIESRDPTECPNCGKNHGGLSINAKASGADMLRYGLIMTQKAVQHMGGDDENQYGNPESN